MRVFQDLDSAWGRGAKILRASSVGNLRIGGMGDCKSIRGSSSLLLCMNTTLERRIISKRKVQAREVIYGEFWQLAGLVRGGER
jgi:hypothetical protein